MLRRGTAAAAQAPGAAPQQLLHGQGEVLGGQLVHRLAVHRHRQPRVGAQHDGQGSDLVQLRQQLQHFRRAQAAVQAQGVHPQPLQQGHQGGDVPAGEQHALFVQGQGDHHGEIRVFLGRQDGRLGLEQVGQGFDEDQVGLIPARLHHAGEGAVGAFKIQVAEGTHQPSGRAHVQGYPGRPLPTVHRLAGDGQPRLHQLGGVFPLEGMGAKGVGADYLAARRQVIPVNGQHLLGMGQVPALRGLAGAQPPGHQLGAHGAVEVGKARLQVFKKFHGPPPRRDRDRLDWGKRRTCAGMRAVRSANLLPRSPIWTAPSSAPRSGVPPGGPFPAAP